MNDSRKGLEEKTKRELVEVLLAEVRAWAGDAPLAVKGQERVAVVLGHLYRCPLWLAELHWQSLCRLWATRATNRVDPWLRDIWVGTLEHWLRFLSEDGFAEDSLPAPRTDSCPPLPMPCASEPLHLPFGFVKPMV